MRIWLAAALLVSAAACGPVSVEAADPAPRADLVPHKATYTLSLDSAKQQSGISDANGELSYQLGETCDGWTIEQRYTLNMDYEDDPPAKIGSSFVTWESKDGLSYRFNEKKTRNDQVEDEIRGDATLQAKDHAGVAKFAKPKEQNIDLPSGSLFPTAHTLTLIHKGETGDNFLAAPVFDGSEFEGSILISAVIGQKNGTTPPVADVKSPLLQKPSWKVHLAFFPEEAKEERPDYELSMRLLESGISSEMTIDYGDYVVKATLKELQSLPKPTC
jgi:EipB-like